MLTAAFSTLLFALLAASTPLGDRSLASRHGAGNGVQVSRRFILASRVDAPPACVALAANASTTVPTDNSTLPLDPTSTSSNSTPPSSPSSPSDATSDDAGSNTNTTIPLEIRPLSDSSSPPPAPSSSSGNGAHVSNSLTRRRHSFGLGKRIAQADLPDIAQQWQDLCLSSGGPIFAGNFSTNTTSSSSSSSSNSNSTDPSDSSPCVTLAGFGGLDALLADADPCAQQDIADLMVLFAKSSPVSNQAALISFAIKYRKHPRNALNVLGIVPSTPYCQRAPKSEELIGVFNDQLDGVDPGVFGGPKFTLVPFGEEGTCPFGQTPDVSTCTCLNSTSTDTGTGASGNATATVTVTDANATPTVSATIAGDDTSVSGTALPVPSPATTSSSSSSSSDDTSDDTSDSPSDPTTDPTTDSSTSDDSNNPSPPATTSPTDSNDSNDNAGGNQPSQNTPKTPGPVFQPDDIDGDVNDPEGRRRRRRAGVVGRSVRRGGRYARGLRA